MKVGVLTKLCQIAFLSSLLFLWDDKTTLAGSVMQSKGKVIFDETQDNSQFPKFLVLDKPSGRKSLIEIEGKTRRKESIQKQTGYECKNATIGECSIPLLDVFMNFTSRSVQQCQANCLHVTKCLIFRFDGHNCLLLTTGYRSDCKVKAGPPHIPIMDCFGLFENGMCNSLLEEDCEYLGEDFGPPQFDIRSPSMCQEVCEANSGCKYWIYHDDKRCILKKDSRRNCKTWVGPKEPSFDYCRHLKLN